MYMLQEIHIYIYFLYLQYIKDKIYERYQTNFRALDSKIEIFFFRNRYKNILVSN